MSALFSLSTLLGLAVAMYAAYVMAHFITGYLALRQDSWERENLGEQR